MFLRDLRHAGGSRQYQIRLREALQSCSKVRQTNSGVTCQTERGQALVRNRLHVVEHSDGDMVGGQVTLEGEPRWPLPVSRDDAVPPHAEESLRPEVRGNEHIVVGEDQIEASAVQVGESAAAPRNKVKLNLRRRSQHLPAKEWAKRGAGIIRAGLGFEPNNPSLRPDRSRGLEYYRIRYNHANWIERHGA